MNIVQPDVKLTGIKEEFPIENKKIIKGNEKEFSFSFDKDEFIKRFALFFGDTFIKGTEFEGGDTAYSISFWSDIIKFIEQPNCPVSPALSQELMEDIKADFENARMGLESIRSGNVNQLIDQIKNGLEKRKRFVLPLDYTGKKGANGHAFVCIFEVVDGNIVCNLLNKGEGSSLHPIVAKNNNKIKQSYRFFPIVLDKKVFDETNKHILDAFFNRFIQFSKVAPETTQNSYNSEELYQLFMLLAKSHSENLSKISESKNEEHDDVLNVELDLTDVTGQRSGTCSEQASRLILRDCILGRHHHQKINFKRVIFSGKYLALNHAFKVFDLTNTQERILMQNAVNEFAIYSEKLRQEGQIEESEAKLALEITQKINQKLQEVIPNPEKLVDIINKPAQQDSIEFPSSHNFFKANEQVAIDKEVKADKETSNLLPPSLSCPEPMNLKSTLENWLNYSKKGNQSFLKSYEALLNFPIPGSEEGKKYWEQIPEEDIKDCILLLNQWVTVLGAKGTHLCNIREELFPYFYMINQSTYAMMDCLARRKPELCLEGFATHLSSAEDLSAQMIFFKPYERERILEIKKYFNYLKENKNEILNFGLSGHLRGK